MHTFKQYYVLTKPGIIYGNLFAAIAGFFLASRGDVSITLFIATMLGLSCIIASACVCNNIMDRKIDAKTMRTKRRALATGIITHFQAIVYGAVLGLVGSAILIYFVNLLAWGVAILGWIGYVVVYGIAKRITSYATEIGSIPGAMPPVVGYSAVTHTLDITSLLLFTILVLWQMPHFFSLSLFQKNDYQKTGLPIVSTKKNEIYLRVASKIYIIGFVISGLFLFMYSHMGIVYLLFFCGLSLYWLHIAFRTAEKYWAKKIFMASLVVLAGWSAAVCIDSLL